MGTIRFFSRGRLALSYLARDFMIRPAELGLDLEELYWVNAPQTLIYLDRGRLLSKWVIKCVLKEGSLV